jgi:uncharacterized protein YecT (DUF1311 family)
MTHLLRLRCALSLFALTLFAIQSPADSGELVRIGDNRYVLEPDSDSPDRRFALAWTVVPKDRSVPPFDWSKWSPENPFAPLDDPSVSDVDDKSSSYKYLARSILVDKERKFATPLDVTLCRISKHMVSGSSASWSISWVFNQDEKPGAVIQTVGRRGLTGLYVLMVGGSKPSVVSVFDPLLDFARAELKRGRVKNVESFNLSSVEVRKAASPAEVALHYSISPLAGEPNYERDARLVIGEGKVSVQQAGQSSAKTSDAGGGSVDEADSRLNQLYKLLQGKLSPEKMTALRTEQRQWIKNRDAAIKSSLAKAGLSPTGKEGKRVSDEITLKWTLERCAELEKMAK